MHSEPDAKPFGHLEWLEKRRNRLLVVIIVTILHLGATVYFQTLSETALSGPTQISKWLAEALPYPLAYVALIFGFYDDFVWPVYIANSLLWAAVAVGIVRFVGNIGHMPWRWWVRRGITVFAGAFVLSYIAAMLSFYWQTTNNQWIYGEIFSTITAPRLLHTVADREYFRSSGPGNAEVLPNGEIEYRVSFPSSGRYYLIPHPNPAGRLEWDCVTADLEWLRYVWPGCNYNPSYRPGAPIIVEVQGRLSLFFDYNRSDLENLSVKDRDGLERMLITLSDPTVRQITRVEITAYSDPTGTEKNNLVVANARATSVRELFFKQGIPRDVVLARVIGSDFHEARDCSKKPTEVLRENCYRSNRRVDIRLSYQVES